MAKHKYETDIVLGEKYRDTQTGYEGVATGIHFYQHGCERATLEAFDENRKNIQELSFDAPRLQHIDSGKIAETPTPGGPARAGESGARSTGTRA